MKKFTALVAGTALATTMAISGAASADTLRMGLLVSNQSLAFRAAEKFAAHVNEATGGEYTVELFPAQQLGSGQEMLQMLKLGTLDFYQGTATQPTLLEEGRNFNALSAPYVFQNQDEFIKFLSSPLFAEMSAEFAVGGAEIIGYMGSRSPRAITTANTPVRTPEDLRGLKMRVPGSPPFAAFFGAMGTVSTPMPFSEFFTSVKTGLVEGQDNGIEVVYPRGLYEIQKYYSKTDHAFGAWMLFSGSAVMDGWSDELRIAVEDGLKIAAEFSDAELAASMEEGFAAVQENGMEVIEVDKGPFIEIARGVWDQMEADDQWDAGMMARIQAQLDEYRN